VFAINLLLERDLGHEIEAIIDRVRAEVADLPARVSGVPIFRTESNRQSQREILLFVPLTVAAIAALLYAAFRARRAVLVSLAASALGTLDARRDGRGPIPLTFSTIILPPILLASAVRATIHVQCDRGARSRPSAPRAWRGGARPPRRSTTGSIPGVCSCRRAIRASACWRGRHVRGERGGTHLVPAALPAAVRRTGRGCTR
jgi:hypothetical protein